MPFPPHAHSDGSVGRPAVPPDRTALRPATGSAFGPAVVPDAPLVPDRALVPDRTLVSDRALVPDRAIGPDRPVRHKAPLRPPGRRGWVAVGLLVALTALPTLVVVLAGRSAVHGPDVRQPSIAEGGPTVIVEPGRGELSGRPMELLAPEGTRPLGPPARRPVDRAESTTGGADERPEAQPCPPAGAPGAGRSGTRGSGSGVGSGSGSGPGGGSGAGSGGAGGSSPAGSGGSGSGESGSGAGGSESGEPSAPGGEPTPEPTGPGTPVDEPDVVPPGTEFSDRIFEELGLRH